MDSLRLRAVTTTSSNAGAALSSCAMEKGVTRAAAIAAARGADLKCFEYMTVILVLLKTLFGLQLILKPSLIVVLTSPYALLVATVPIGSEQLTEKK